MDWQAGWTAGRGMPALVDLRRNTVKGYLGAGTNCEAIKGLRRQTADGQAVQQILLVVQEELAAERLVAPGMPRMLLPKLWKAAMRPRAGSGKRSLPKRLGSGRKHYSRAGSGRMRSEASRGHWPGGTSIGNRARRRLDRRRSRMTEGPSRRVGVDVRPKPVRNAMLDGLRQAGLPEG